MRPPATAHIGIGRLNRVRTRQPRPWPGGRVSPALHSLLAVLLAATAALAPAQPARAAAAAGAVGGVDGVSDQSMPAWGEQGPALAAALFDAGPAGRSGPTMARYVVQWDALSQPSAGPDADGDYRERFEAWLADARAERLGEVVALTSYDGTRPRSAAGYAAALRALLARAAASGAPIRWLEPWNEPNNQGHERARAAAILANAAERACAVHDCEVLAGGFEDAPAAAAYVREYERALDFRPRAWAVHPYVSVAAHDDRTLRALLASLPGAQLWATEVGALYCSRGRVRGEARQAADARYLVDGLIRDPSVAFAHVFYYGAMFAGGRPAPCSLSGGQDSELFAPGARPRAAAELVFPAAAAAVRSLSFGPGPGGPGAPGLSPV